MSTPDRPSVSWTPEQLSSARATLRPVERRVLPPRINRGVAAQRFGEWDSGTLLNSREESLVSNIEGEGEPSTSHTPTVAERKRALNRSSRGSFDELGRRREREVHLGGEGESPSGGASGGREDSRVQGDNISPHHSSIANATQLDNVTNPFLDFSQPPFSSTPAQSQSQCHPQFPATPVTSRNSGGGRRPSSQQVRRKDEDEQEITTILSMQHLADFYDEEMNRFIDEGVYEPHIFKDLHGRLVTEILQLFVKEFLTFGNLDHLQSKVEKLKRELGQRFPAHLQRSNLKLQQQQQARSTSQHQPPPPPLPEQLAQPNPPQVPDPQQPANVPQPVVQAQQATSAQQNQQLPPPIPPHYRPTEGVPQQITSQNQTFGLPNPTLPLGQQLNPPQMFPQPTLPVNQPNLPLYGQQQINYPRSNVMSHQQPNPFLYPPQMQPGYGQQLGASNQQQLYQQTALPQQQQLFSGYGQSQQQSTFLPPPPPPNPNQTFGNLTSTQEVASIVSQVVGQQQQQTQCLVSRQSKANKLTNFGGDPLDWPLFLFRYQQSTRDCNYSASENVARLGDALRGEALRYVQPLLYTPNSDPNLIMGKLHSRYGNSANIIEHLEQVVKDMPAPSSKDLSNLPEFSSALSNLVATIKSLGEVVYLHNPSLIKQLVGKLPRDMKMGWGKIVARTPNASLEHFSSFIEEEANAASFVSTPTFTSSNSSSSREKEKEKKKPRGDESVFANAAPTSSKKESKPDNNSKCILGCKNEKHRVPACPKFKDRSVDERWKVAKENKLCFRCLTPKCSMPTCKSRRICKEDGCTRRLHPLLHGSRVAPPQPQQPEPNAPPAEPIQDVNGHVNDSTALATSVILRVLPVTLYGPGGQVYVNAILDEASTVTMLCESIANQIGLKGHLDPLRINWTDGSSQSDNSSRKVRVEIGPVHRTTKYTMAEVRTVRNLNLPAQYVNFEEIVAAYPHLKGVKLKVLPNAKPMILIGQPHIHLTLARAVMEGDPAAPVATETKLGWVLHGPTRGSTVTHHTFTCYHEADSDIIHNLVKESFALESIGIRSYATSRSREDRRAEEMIEAVTRRVGERWETGLLWRKEPGSSLPPCQQQDEESRMSGCTATGSPCRGGTSTTTGGTAVLVPEALEGHCARTPLPVELERPDAGPGILALPPSYTTAYRRLLGVEKRLRRSESLKAEFSAKIQHYVKMGYARKLTSAELAVPTPKQWFLPIFPVFNPNKPGKLRLVFDAACKSYGKSLNDFLVTGPDLLVSLPGLLLNFRLRKVAFSGDITEMFHQVQIRPDDQPAQRFLWRESEESKPDVYQLQVMMFGAVCSPYCAQYIKNRNGLEFAEEFPAAARAITEKHYMDDCIHSMDSEEEAISLIKDVRKVHAKGGFHIGKWISNSTTVLESIEPEDRVPAAKDLSCWSEIPTERALGLHWNPKEDCFLFKLNLDRAGEGVATGEKIPTKRAILRLIMLVWDPLGFLNNYMIKARILLQQLWRSELDWDAEIPEEIFEVWKTWVKKLALIEDLRIPRCYSSIITSSPDVQLHVFADASDYAHCAVAYLRISTADGIITRFVMSKCRESPLKPASTPRLERTAALIASRLGKFITEMIEVPIKSVYFWTDSTTVLKWLRSEAKRFQQFVSNRIGEIHENSEVSNWRWVPTKVNIADDGTRKGKCNISNDSLWWTGPDFLKSPEEDWPVEEICHGEEVEQLELRKEHVLAVLEVPEFDYLPRIVRFSNYSRLVRATAYVLKACEKFRDKSASQLPLPVVKAELLLIKRSQWEEYPLEMQLLSQGQPIPKTSQLYKLSPILDHEGVLRMKSRLSSSQEEGIRMPIIISKKNYLTHLMIYFYHRKAMHQGEEHVRNELRQRFWIPYIRSAIRFEIRNCMICKLKKLRAVAPEMGDIPDFRIQRQSRPFTVCGMDYFGPLFITVGRSQVKVYGVIFTCLTIRAVHLEIANDLSTDACIMAIRRMIARRGQPTTIWSDNGTNLRGADKELKASIQELNERKINEEFAITGPEWKFIPPASPHFGATWERLVRNVKVALYAVLKERAPKMEVLQTLFAEVEAIVNSRPLTEVPSDPEAPESLTPFYFLIGSSSVTQPPGVFDEKDLSLRKRWRQSQALAEMFWTRWTKEYIPTLQKRTKWYEKGENIKVGDVVVLFDESLRRGYYPLGIITDVSPGKDGVVRVVELRTSTGVYTRPVVKIGRLGISAVGDVKGEYSASIEGKDVEGNMDRVGLRETPHQLKDEDRDRTGRNGEGEP